MIEDNIPTQTPLAKNETALNFAEKHPKWAKAATIGSLAAIGAGVVGTTAFAVQKFTEPTASEIASASAQAELTSDQKQFQDALDAPMKTENLVTDAQGDIQVITVEAGNARPFAMAQSLVEGNPTYEANQDFTDKALLASAKQLGITQPGQELYVEKVDVNQDGKDEFIVKDASVGFEPSDNAQLPTPKVG